MKAHFVSLCICILVCVTAASSQAQTFTDLTDFNPNAWIPTYSLLQGTDGNLYGTTNRNAGSLGGALFKFTSHGTLEIIYTFCKETGCTDGSTPSGALVEAPNGLLYSTTSGGGAFNIGTAFSITAGGTLTTIYSFGSQQNDGVNPYSGLVLGRNNTLYGTTYSGGTIGGGTVYKLTLGGVKSTIYNFCQLTRCRDGAAPYGPLIQATNGKLYGATIAGGCCNAGTIFAVTPSGALKTVYSFCRQSKCQDGGQPNGVIQASDGNLYGTTSVGGTYHHGGVFKLTTSGVFTPLYSFCGCGDGAQPAAPLVQANDGNFYGTTFKGGAKV